MLAQFVVGLAFDPNKAPLTQVLLTPIGSTIETYLETEAETCLLAPVTFPEATMLRTAFELATRAVAVKKV